MKILKKIYIKVYYSLAHRLLVTKKVDIPDDYLNHINLIVYFDYEREFSGHTTNISDKDIFSLLRLLKEYSIKATWFTVGKIFYKYPETIKALIKDKHEVASHSFFHKPPFKMKRKELKKDLQLFHLAAKGKCILKGYHSPNGQWSFLLIRYLHRFSYNYDLIYSKEPNDRLPQVIGRRKKQQIRLKTIGDDWPLYSKTEPNNNRNEYFINKIKGLKKGDIIAIGFHPWVLFDDKKILESFIAFLEYVSSNNVYSTRTAGETAMSLINAQKHT